MNESAIARPSGSSVLAQAGLVLGAVIAGAVVPMGILTVALGAGMAVVVGLGLDQALGVPVYVVALASGVAAYWAGIHATITLAGKHMRVPWVVWVALAVGPLAWAIFAAGGGSRGASEALPSWIAGISMLGAWFSLGARRRSLERESTV